jgi:DNA-binding response OmpR family regulator
MDQPFRKRIILSDDINRALSQIDCYLHRGGYEVRVGRTGEEILSLAHREPADAVLINYYLAGPKADEVCRSLRRTRAGVPVVIVGPGHPAEIGEACRAAGCDEYIGSPAAPNILLQRLAAVLGLQFRLQTRVPAVISISVGRIVREFLGYSKDISEGGILVETVLELDRGKRLHLRLFLDDREEPIVTRATVLRVDRAADEDQFLVGMQFQPLDPENASRLRDFIRSRSDH